MLLRCAVMATGVMISGLAFATGVGVGAAAVGGACLARKAMKRRSRWRDEDQAMAPHTPNPGGDLASPEAMPS